MILRKLTADPAVAQSATTDMVSGPAAKGLAEITIDPEDRRIHVVSLIIKAEEPLLKSLSADEREMFRTLLSKVYEAPE